MNTGKYLSKYSSPLGMLTLSSDGENITGLWIEGQKYFAASLSSDAVYRELPVFEEAFHWLDIYFAGENPDFMPKLDKLPPMEKLQTNLKIPTRTIPLHRQLAGRSHEIPYPF